MGVLLKEPLAPLACQANILVTKRVVLERAHKDLSPQVVIGIDFPDHRRTGASSMRTAAHSRPRRSRRCWITMEIIWFLVGVLRTTAPRKKPRSASGARSQGEFVKIKTCSNAIRE